MTQDAMTSGEKRASIGLALVFSFRMLGLFMILPIFSHYGQSLAGSTPLLIGLAIGAYGFSQAVLQVPFGFISDRIGRKPVILFGLLMFAIGSVVAALSDSIYGVLVGRFLQGGGAIASTVMALLSDLTREQHRTKAMAMVGMSIGLSFSIALVAGPLLGGWLGLSGIFWLTAFLACIGIVIVVWGVPTPTTQVAYREAVVSSGAFTEVLRHGQLWRLNVGVFVLHLTMTAMFIVMPAMLLQHTELVVDEHWQVYLPILLVSFVVMVPFIIVGEKKRKLKPIFCSAVLLLALASLFLSRVAESAWWILIWLFFYFLSFNLLEATLPSLVSKWAPPAAKGAAMGVYSSSQFLGAAVGGGVGGWLLGAYGGASVFIVCGTLAVLWFLYAVTMKTPPYVTSLMVPLSQVEHDTASQLLDELLALRGVEDAVVIPEEKAAYLKVDNKRFDKSLLARFS